MWSLLITLYPAQVESDVVCECIPCPQVKVMLTAERDRNNHERDCLNEAVLSMNVRIQELVSEMAKQDVKANKAISGSKSELNKSLEQTVALQTKMQAMEESADDLKHTIERIHEKIETGSKDNVGLLVRESMKEHAKVHGTNASVDMFLSFYI